MKLLALLQFAVLCCFTESKHTVFRVSKYKHGVSQGSQALVVVWPSDGYEVKRREVGCFAVTAEFWR
jgi:hypothetical protein